MSSPTFHRLSDLPPELQIHIWEYAASTEGGLKLAESLFSDNSVDEAMRCGRSHISLKWFFGHLWDNIRRYTDPEAVASAREAMRARSRVGLVCRFTRQVVLETYMREVGSIYVKGDMPAENRYWIISYTMIWCRDKIGNYFADTIKSVSPCFSTFHYTDHDQGFEQWNLRRS